MVLTIFWGQRKGTINLRVGPEANKNKCQTLPWFKGEELTHAAWGGMGKRQEGVISRPPALVLNLHAVGSNMVLCQADIVAPLFTFCCMSDWIVSASWFLRAATEKSPQKNPKDSTLYHPLEMTHQQWRLSPQWHSSFLGMPFSHWKASS